MQKQLPLFAADRWEAMFVEIFPLTNLCRIECSEVSKPESVQAAVPEIAASAMKDG